MSENPTQIFSCTKTNCICSVSYGYIIAQNKLYKELRKIPTMCDACGHTLEMHGKKT